MAKLDLQLVLDLKPIEPEGELIPIRRPEGTRGVFDNPNKQLDALLGDGNLDDFMPFDAKFDFGRIIKMTESPSETEDKVKLSMFYKSIADINPKISFNLMDKLNKIIVGGDINPSAMWKHYQEQYKETKTYVDALKHGYRRAGVMMTKQLAGLGKMEAEFGGRARDWLWGALGRAKPKYSQAIDDKLTEWSDMMLAGVQEYYQTNKKEAIQIMPGLGYMNTMLQYVFEPKNLIQGIVESSPLILEGILGNVFGGAGAAITTMAMPITGGVYAQARAEGTEPLPALAQSMLTGVGEATIEQWTLGKKLGLMKNFKKIVTDGLPKLLWEGVKLFFRGTAEEGSQEFNQNFWQWMFTDRSQQWSENVAESAAAGGPMELVMGGAFAAVGAAGGAVAKDQQAARLDKIAEAVETTPDLTETHKVEIRKEIDKVAEAIENDEFEVAEEIEKPAEAIEKPPSKPTEAITAPEGEIVAPEKVEGTVEQFEDLGEQQRGKPESAMIKATTHHSGAWSWLIEHVGDLTHRMTQGVAEGQAGFGASKPKIERAFHFIRSGQFGKTIEEAHEENIINNIKHSNLTESEFRAKLKQLGEQYSTEHAKLPVFNEVQRRARDAAVALGKQDFETADEHITWLKKLIDKGEDAWNKEALKGLVTLIPQPEAKQPTEKVEVPKAKKPSKVIEKKAEGPIQKFIKVEKEVIPKQPKETFTPPVVQKEIGEETELETPDSDSETQNATNLLEGYWAEFDVRELEINVAATKNQESISKALNKKQYLPETDIETSKMSQAMMLYIDLKEHPSGNQFADQISKAQRELYDLSKNLPKNIQKIADNIIEQNRVAGALAVEKDVIANARENYIAHLWQKPVRQEALRARFRQTTARAKARTLEGGIMEGWARGKKLRINDVTLATQIAQSQINQAIVGREMLNLGKKWGLLSHKQAEDWVRVEHPGFNTWKWAGKAEKAKTYGQNFFVTENGDLMERVPVYAEPKLGKVLNNVFASSGLYGKGEGGLWNTFVKTVTRYNAHIKSTILFTSLFHHQAYLRSYAFGSKGINPTKAYRQGRQAIMNMTPEVRLLTRNGLTTGRIQDFDPRMIEGEQTIWGKALAQFKPTDIARKKFIALRDQQTRFLFNKLGPALKIQAGILELRAELKRNQAELESGEITADEIAAAVANLMNNDFGGLHLGRMGRNNTAQHIFRLLALAPDWTESNIRSAVQAFAKGETGYLHRMFWGRIAAKGLGATILFNLLLSAFDDDDFAERYKKAWETGRLRWLDIDITPVFQALGGADDKRKYFSLIGHFRDPIKFAVHPFVSAKHKGSVVSRIMFDMMIGEDWAGRKFTTLGELTGITEDGKNSGRLVKYGRGGARPIEPSQIPSYALYEVRSTMPIPMQNLIAFLGGEMDAFDAITKSAGLMTATTFPERGKGGRKQVRRKR